MLEGIWIPGGRRAGPEAGGAGENGTGPSTVQPGSLSVNKLLYLEVFHAMHQSTRTK